MEKVQWRNRLSDAERRKLVDLASKTLWDPRGKEALRYLTEDRGFSEDTIRQFSMGYVPYKINHQLNGRLITPIRDPYGNIVAVSTRHMYKTKKEKGYFWHEEFDKSFYLYGMDLAKKHILRYQKAVLVEGEFDVASLHTHGITFGVGICGSAFSLFQAAVVARYCRTLYVLFDADEGGRTATARLKDLEREVLHGLDIIYCKLPKGYDPDKFVRERGRAELINIMKAAKEEHEQIGSTY